MRLIYSVYFIGVGNIRKSRCHDVESALQKIADSCDEIVCISPYTIPVPGKPIPLVNGQIQIPPPAIVPGFMIITATADVESKGEEQVQLALMQDGSEDEKGK